MATPLERPKTPISMIVFGVLGAAIVGLLLLRWVIGMVLTVAKLGIAVAIVVAIIVVIGRLFDSDD